mmetsp:Transcript_25840/g.66504  ORF Transcript_25840/g.66504 Transcript_25840/m.66504 type:complete len:423 (-) Transcript_25840:113-1381(-)|eukprot:jgi/Tetstr1/436596/TSEL_025393.t1
MAGAQSSILDAAEDLGLNAALDLDLLWVAQEYLNAQLPEGWMAVTYPDQSIHYINESLRVDVTDNPILPRFKLLAKFMLRWKERQEPPDEMTVLELLDPIDRVMDVKEMVDFMGIDPVSESHLMWLAKMNVLEALPHGWQEQEMPDGSIVYLNLDEGRSTTEHPNDREYKEILVRERTRQVPYKSIQPDYYEWPVTYHKKAVDAKGKELTTPVVPFTGTYIDFYDIYGRHFWYDIVTDHVTMDVMEVKYIPAVITLQRIFRGFITRQYILKLDMTVRKICRTWKTSRFRRAVEEASARRLTAVLRIQRFFRNKQMQVAQSRYLYRRLGMAGSRPGRPVRRRIEGVVASGYSFVRVRRAVIFLQRMWRQTLVKMARRRYAEEHREELQAEVKEKNSKLKSFRMLRSRKNFGGGSDVSSDIRVS